MRGMAMQALTGLAVCACAVGAITVPLVVLGVPAPGRIVAIRIAQGARGVGDRHRAWVTARRGAERSS